MHSEGDGHSRQMPVSLFYLYADLHDVAPSLVSYVTTLGAQCSLGGRIRIATEGINGTIGGTEDGVTHFESSVSQYLGKTIDFKRSPGDAHHFPKGFSVRMCTEIVTLGLHPDACSWKNAADHLSPAQFLEEAKTRVDDDAVLLDCRNEYEHAIGRFDGAVTPNIRQFSVSILRSTFPFAALNLQGLTSGRDPTNVANRIFRTMSEIT